MCVCVTVSLSVARRWRAKVILLRIPVRDRPEVQLKAIAWGALNRRRGQWGHNRRWTGNYLQLQDENPNYRGFEASLTHLKRSHSFDKVLFSCNVMKVSSLFFPSLSLLSLHPSPSLSPSLSLLPTPSLSFFHSYSGSIFDC